MSEIQTPLATADISSAEIVAAMDEDDLIENLGAIDTARQELHDRLDRVEANRSMFAEELLRRARAQRQDRILHDDYDIKVTHKRVREVTNAHGVLSAVETLVENGVVPSAEGFRAAWLEPVVRTHLSRLDELIKHYGKRVAEAVGPFIEDKGTSYALSFKRKQRKVVELQEGDVSRDMLQSGY
jgi:hypothetical protein